MGRGRAADWLEDWTPVLAGRGPPSERGGPHPGPAEPLGLVAAYIRELKDQIELSGSSEEA